MPKFKTNSQNTNKKNPFFHFCFVAFSVCLLFTLSGTGEKQGIFFSFQSSLTANRAVQFFFPRLHCFYINNGSNSETMQPKLKTLVVRAFA